MLNLDYPVLTERHDVYFMSFFSARYYLLLIFCATPLFAQRPVLTDKNDRKIEQDLLKQQSSDAVQRYNGLMRKHPKMEAQMMPNLLFLHRKAYDKTGVFNTYQSQLDRNLRGGKYLTITHQHFKQLIAAQNKRTKRAADVGAFVKLVQAYMTHLPSNDSEQRRSYDEMIGRTYVRMAMHQQASRHYEQMSNTPGYEKEDVYLGIAVTQRERQYKVSSEPSWKLGQKIAAHRDLMMLYERQLRLMPGLWLARAKYGFQIIAQGARREAFENWKSELTQSSVHARRAAGYIVQSYHNDKDWPTQEAFIKDIIKRGVRAEGMPRPQADYLADALYEQGYAAFLSQDFATAKDKLLELVSGHKLHMERALFYLAQSYWNLGESEIAVTTMVRHIEGFPKSKVMQHAIRFVAQWSVQMANEDMAIKYFQIYVQRYDFMDIYDEYLALLQGRELYFEANDLLRKAIRRNKNDAAPQLLHNSYYFGSPEEARKDISFVESSAAGGASEFSHYLAAKLAYSRKNDKELRTRISRIQTPYYKQELMLFLALGSADFLDTEVFSLALKNPLGELEKQRTLFAGLQQRFEEICGLARNSYCALSLLELANMCTRQIQRLVDMKMSEAFEESMVQNFESAKKSELDRLTRLRDQSRQNSMEPLRSSRSLPLTTDAVLWANSRDWNFDRITGEIRNGYVQLEVLK